MRVLFLTWDGPDQTYLESLFLPIFGRLREAGSELSVLQFSSAEDAELEPTRAAARRHGVPYASRRVSRSFGAAGLALGVARGAHSVAAHAREHGIDVLFPRSLMPASMALLAAPRLPGTRLVFDADGLMADERVDFAGWNPRGVTYRLLRDVEAEATRRAASVIVRTEQAKEIVLDRAGAGTDPEKVFVIPNAKDTSLFDPGTPEGRARTRERYGVAADEPWIVYTGSLGPQYRPEAMVALFQAISRRLPATRIQFFTFQEATLRELLQRLNVSAERVAFRRAAPVEIASCLAAADLGLALRAETFSQRAVSPIKVAEYLLSGVPVVSTRVGDLVTQIGDRDVGFLVADGSSPAIEAAAHWFVERVRSDREGFRARCRRAGEELFGLDRCAEAYRRAFDRARTLAFRPARRLG